MGLNIFEVGAGGVFLRASGRGAGGSRKNSGDGWMVVIMASPVWGIIPNQGGGWQDNYLVFVWVWEETRNMERETRNLGGVGSWNGDGRGGATWCGLGWGEPQMGGDGRGLIGIILSGVCGGGWLGIFARFIPTFAWV